jgi:hypothetical protein
MRTDLRTGIPSESSHGKFLRFIKFVVQMSYCTPKMEARYAFFGPVRTIFYLWQISIISMPDFYRDLHAGLQQRLGFQFELPARAPRADDGLDAPGKPQYGARAEPTDLARGMLPNDHRLGIRDHDFGLVGRMADNTRAARNCRRV